MGAQLKSYAEKCGVTLPGDSTQTTLVLRR